MTRMLTHGTFTVSYIRNGNIVTIFTEVKRAETSDGATLVQFWRTDPDTGAGGVSADTNWSDPTKQPVIHIKARSSAGYPVTIKEVKWSYGSATLYFPTINDYEWTAEASSDPKPFAVKIVGGEYCLRVTGNLISADFMGNKQITYEVTYESLGIQDTVRGGVTVWLIQGSKGAMLLFITTNRKEISIDYPTATLTGTAYLGEEEQVIDKTSQDTAYFYLKWYDAEGEITGAGSVSASTKYCYITRDIIQGAEVIYADLMWHSGVQGEDDKKITQGMVTIHDIDDEYQIYARPLEDGGNWVGKDHSAKYQCEVYRNGELLDITLMNPSWTWKVFNELGAITKPDGTGRVVEVKPEYCHFVFDTGPEELIPEGNTQVPGEGYGDATVEVTAQWDE